MKALCVRDTGRLWGTVVMLALLPLSTGAVEIGTRDFAHVARLNPLLEQKTALLGRRFEIVLARHTLTLEAAVTRCRSGEQAACGLQEWQEFLLGIQSLSEEDRIYLVHRYVNRFRYVTDLRNWRRPDYWAVPEEFFEEGGDCEDYAIAKYLSLRAVGISENRLRLVVVLDRTKREEHAILAVMGAKEILVLDNYHRRVMTWSEIADRYKPSYSLNENTVWIHSTGS